MSPELARQQAVPPLSLRPGFRINCMVTACGLALKSVHARDAGEAGKPGCTGDGGRRGGDDAPRPCICFGHGRFDRVIRLGPASRSAAESISLKEFCWRDAKYHGDSLSDRKKLFADK
jgi:hypothetical protein